jgi:cell pole-organizing protein PopZ
MTKPEKAGEPNMDDILASIRKLIADEPGADRGAAERRVVNPLIESALSGAGSHAAEAEEPLLPPIDRLSGALRGATSMGAAVDDDLTDLFEDAPSDGEGARAAARSGAAQDGSRNGMLSAPRDALSGAQFEARGAQRSGAQSSTASAIAAALAGQDGEGEGPGTQEGGAKSGSSVPDFSLAFPKAQSQQAAETLDPLGAERVASAEPRAAAAFVAVPMTPAEIARQAEAESAARDSKGQAQGPVVIAAMHAGGTPQSFPDFPFDPPGGAWKPAFSGGGTGGALMAAGAAAPASALARFQSPGVDRETQAAAASALGALAAGLAASSGVDASRLAGHQSGFAGAAQRLGAGDAQGTSVRTLEDMVADMLRPMLERWVQENMPRIMEKALRGEVMKSGAMKPGTKI